MCDVLLCRAGAGSHGHVHGAGHTLLQVQAGEDEGTSGVVLVTCKHSKGMCHVVSYQSPGSGCYPVMCSAC